MYQAGWKSWIRSMEVWQCRLVIIWSDNAWRWKTDGTWSMYQQYCAMKRMTTEEYCVLLHAAVTNRIRYHSQFVSLIQTGQDSLVVYIDNLHPMQASLGLWHLMANRPVSLDLSLAATTLKYRGGTFYLIPSIYDVWLIIALFVVHATWDDHLPVKSI